MKILLLEDDEIIANSIKEYFELFDKEVRIFENAKALVGGWRPFPFMILLVLD